MADSSDRPALQMFRQAFPENAPASLEKYLQDGGSVFQLVETGLQGLTREYGLNDEQARHFLRQANSLATWIRRQYLERRMSGGSTTNHPSSGLLSMVTGPVYGRLFTTDFARMCPPEALESCVSPVAYLIELLRWIRDRIEPFGLDGIKYPLNDRRKDLQELSVDYNAVYQSISSVEVILSVLETFIDEEEEELITSLIEARYPNGLPYFQHWVTCDAIARHNNLSVGEFAHETDLAFPYFLQSDAYSAEAGRALAHASRMGPYQRVLLTEAFTTDEKKEAFYLANYGADSIQYQELHMVKILGLQTKLSAAAIEALLAVGMNRPIRSPNVTFVAQLTDEPESNLSGAVYISAGLGSVITIKGDPDHPSLHRLSITSAEHFVQFDRINRKIRLDDWLKLLTEQVDALLAAAIRAEVRGGAAAGEWKISENVIHALGLFQVLREQHQCTAEDFAVFIDHIGLYGRGERAAQFDQVFNALGRYVQPLRLDNEMFVPVPAEGAADLTANQISSGLAIDPQTYAYLAMVIAQHQGKEVGGVIKLTRNAAVVSAFYRLVRLPRLLGITPVEGVLLLGLLGGDEWIKSLAAEPQINSTPGSTPDALNVIHALYSCVSWCHARDLPVSWVIQNASPLLPLDAVTEAELQLYDKVRNLLPAALFTQAGLLMAGVPASPIAGWLDLLGALVDPLGLVLAIDVAESDYPDYARERLDAAVRDGLGDIDDASRLTIVEQMLQVLLQAREAQVSVARECLAVYTGLEAEQAVRVLFWTGTTVYRLLWEVSERTDLAADPARRDRTTEPDQLSVVLADLKRRSAVVAKLNLSAVLLQDYLDYGHKAWLEQDDKFAFSLRTLYYLERLARAFELSDQPPSQLLDYLRQVNTLSGSLSEHANAVPGDPLEHAMKVYEQAAAIRLAVFFGWSVQEVLECIDRMGLSTSPKFVKNLTQLDLLMRVRMLASRTGMDALTIFLLGKLPESVSDRDAYKSAAEHALLSLSQTRASVVPHLDDLRKLIQVTCVVDKYEAIANKPGEKIKFTVTANDAEGNPLDGLRVHWRSRLGRIATGVTSSGKLEAEFFPLGEMGTETPDLWFDLLFGLQAPQIHVIYDVDSLTFPAPLKSQGPYDNKVSLGEIVELYAVLTDGFGNPVGDAAVEWGIAPSDGTKSTAVIRPVKTRTDTAGYTKVEVSSEVAAQCQAFVLSEDGSKPKTYFTEFSFVEPDNRS